MPESGSQLVQSIILYTPWPHCMVNLSRTRHLWMSLTGSLYPFSIPMDMNTAGTAIDYGERTDSQDSGSFVEELTWIVIGVSNSALDRLATHAAKAFPVKMPGKRWKHLTCVNGCEIKLRVAQNLSPTWTF